MHEAIEQKEYEEATRLFNWELVSEGAQLEDPDGCSELLEAGMLAASEAGEAELVRVYGEVYNELFGRTVRPLQRHLSQARVVQALHHSNRMTELPKFLVLPGYKSCAQLKTAHCVVALNACVQEEGGMAAVKGVLELMAARGLVWSSQVYSLVMLHYADIGDGEAVRKLWEHVQHLCSTPAAKAGQKAQRKKARRRGQLRDTDKPIVVQAAYVQALVRLQQEREAVSELLAMLGSSSRKAPPEWPWGNCRKRAQAIRQPWVVPKTRLVELVRLGRMLEWRSGDRTGIAESWLQEEEAAQPSPAQNERAGAASVSLPWPRLEPRGSLQQEQAAALYWRLPFRTEIKHVLRACRDVLAQLTLNVDSRSGHDPAKFDLAREVLAAIGRVGLPWSIGMLDNALKLKLMDSSTDTAALEEEVFHLRRENGLRLPGPTGSLLLRCRGRFGEPTKVHRLLQEMVDADSRRLHPVDFSDVARIMLIEAGDAAAVREVYGLLKATASRKGWKLPESIMVTMFHMVSAEARAEYEVATDDEPWLEAAASDKLQQCTRAFVEELRGYESDMKDSGMLFDARLLLHLLQAYCNCVPLGLDDLARLLHAAQTGELETVPSFKLTSQHYLVAVMAAARRGYLSKARAAMDHMLDAGFAPGPAAYVAMLQGLALRQDQEGFDAAWQEMLEAGAQPGAEALLARARLHAHLNQLDAAVEDVRECLPLVRDNYVPRWGWRPLVVGALLHNRPDTLAELLAVLPASQRAEVQEWAEKVRPKVQAEDVPHDATARPVEVSG